MERPVLKDPSYRDAQRRVRAWTRARFGLPDGAMIVVSERAGTIPGGPPVETAIGFWTGDDARYHFRVFKPLAEIAENDLPYAWQKESLAVPPDWQCECC